MPIPSRRRRSPRAAAIGVPAAGQWTNGLRRDARADRRRLEDGGQQPESISAASSIGCDQQRLATSSISVPDASATSIACSPLSRKRM
jgi:hypothetical protein